MGKVKSIFCVRHAYIIGIVAYLHAWANGGVLPGFSQKPWCVRLRKERDFYQKRKDMDNFKLWRNKTKSLIQQPKKSYYSEAIIKTKRNPKQHWKHLHDLTNNTKCHQNPSISDAKGDPILGPEETANTFNNFFISVFQKHNGSNNETNYTNEKLKEYTETKLSPEDRFKIP